MSTPDNMTREEYRATLDTVGLDEHDKPITVNPATGEATSQPTGKVLAATTGAGIGAALSTLTVYAFEQLTHVDLPQYVESAWLVVVSAGLAYGLGWLKRP